MVSCPTCHLLGDSETDEFMLDGAAVIDLLTEVTDSLGVDMRTGTPMTDLVIENGKIIGVYVVNADDNEIQIDASRGIILASGGYVDDKEMYQYILR